MSSFLGIFLVVQKTLNIFSPALRALGSSKWVLVVWNLPGLSSVLEESYGVMCSGMQVDGLTLGGWWVSKAWENGGEKTGPKKNITEVY